MISVCRRRGKQTGTSINVSTLTVVKPNNTFHFSLHDKIFSFCFYCGINFAFALAGKFLLGRNLNQIVFHKKTRPCSRLWRQPLMMITVAIGKNTCHYWISLIVLQLSEQWLSFWNQFSRQCKPKSARLLWQLQASVCLFCYIWRHLRENDSIVFINSAILNSTMSCQSPPSQQAKHRSIINHSF